MDHMFSHQNQITHNYKLPKMELATNDYQLKKLRQKYLMNHYQKEIAQKNIQTHNNRNLKNNPYSNHIKSPSNFDHHVKNILNSNQYQQQYHTNTPLIGYINSNPYAYKQNHHRSHLTTNPELSQPLSKQLQIKKYLAQDLQQQIKLRQVSTLKSKKQQTSQQKLYMDYMSKAFQQEHQRQLQMKQKFRKQIMNNYYENQQRKRKMKEQQRMSKWIQHEDLFNKLSNRHNRRSQGNLHRLTNDYHNRNSFNFKYMYGNENNNRKQNKKDNISGNARVGMNINRSSTSIDNYQKKLNSQQSTPSNKNIINSKQRKGLNDQSQSLPSQFIKNPQLHLFKLRNEYDNQQRVDLKETLLKQMEQARQRRNKSKKDYFQNQKSQQMYMNKHNPIVNPVDFRITNDNRYILNQLKAQKEKQMMTNNK